MQRTRYVTDYAGTGELLRRTETQKLVNQYTQQKANAAGDGFVASNRQGETRYRGIVYAVTWSAKHRERRENVLVRVLG